MKIGILSRGIALYSTQSLSRAGSRRGHQVQIIDHLRCNLILEPDTPQIHYEGQRLQGLEAVIPRIGASVTAYGASVIKQFELMGIYSTVRSNALLLSRDKLRSLQKLSIGGIQIPKTFVVNNLEELPYLLKSFRGAPVVIKLLEGTHGAGVILSETLNTTISIIEAFQKAEQQVLIQEFIEEAQGADIRAIVVGGRVVASMKRQAMAGEFRSNLHRGASAHAINLTPEEEKVAKKSARLLGLDVAGVDMLQSSRGPLVMEVNASPGLEGIEGATGVDVAGEIINFVSEKVRKLKAYHREQAWKARR